MEQTADLDLVCKEFYTNKHFLQLDNSVLSSINSKVHFEIHFNRIASDWVGACKCFKLLKFYCNFIVSTLRRALRKCRLHNICLLFALHFFIFK